MERNQLVAGELPETGAFRADQAGDGFAHLFEERRRVETGGDVSRHLCQRVESASLRTSDLVDETGVAQCENGEQTNLLETFQLVGDEWAVASPAQDQHRADGVADGQWHDRRVMHHQEG